jgi:hypothetical protein
MPALASRLAGIPERTAAAPWPQHEFVRGWGVFALPFDSGHVLALRVFPQGTFGPYRTVWHRDPDGRWSIYVDGAQPEHACPRYYGPALARQAQATIDLTWTGSHSLSIHMDEPALTWTLTSSTTPALALVNAASALMPAASWRHPSLLRARETVARALGMGSLQLAGTMPSGHVGVLMPKRMYFVDNARAHMDGVDFGHPVRLDHNPTIGDVPLPARGVLAQGEARWHVLDEGAET